MARKNRKKRQLNTFAVPAPLAGLAIVLGVLALGYVWQESRCEAVGKELKKLELEQENLRKQYINEECKWTRMKTPRELEKALARFGIDMTWPRNDQIIRVCDLAFSDEGMVAETADDALQFARLERALMP